MSVFAFALFKKLIDRGMPDVFVRLLVYWYRTQNACVRWSTACSEMFTVSNGVRQGGILSPLFFNVYMDGLSDILCKTECGCTMGGRMINHLMYADDVVLLSPSAKGLQRLINICAAYGDSHDIKFNHAKTVCMYLPSKGNCTLNSPLIYLNSQLLSLVPKFKYLGSLITQDNSDDENMRRQRFHHCSASIKVNLIKTYCAPYCSQLWVNHTKCSYNKLRVAYNNAYRRVLGYVKSDSASNMFVNNQVDNFDAHNRHLIYSLRSRILNCNNSIVVCLNDCFYIRGRYMWTSWQKSLYTV